MELKHTKSGKALRDIVLLLALVIFPAVTLTAQEKRVTISNKSITIREAIKEIEVQTGYAFGFKSRDFDASRRVNLPRLEGTTKEMLRLILDSSKQTWEMNGNYIMIIPAVPQPRPAAILADPVPYQPEVVQGYSVPTETVLLTLAPELEPTPAPRGGYATASRLRETPLVGIKSNLLFDATLTISLGAEVRLAQKTTLDIPFTHNSWGRINDREWENFSVQPGIRFWTCEAFNGFFWGVHAHYAKYNVSNLPSPPFSESMSDYRYEGQLVGAGVNAGYQWMLGKRWAIEAELGLGYAYLWYDKYRCATCAPLINSETKNYFGPTKAGVSLIFMIK